MEIAECNENAIRHPFGTLVSIGTVNEDHEGRYTRYFLFVPDQDAIENGTMTEPDARKVREYIEEMLPPVGCHHEFDCCGCYFTRGGYLVNKEQFRKAWILAQDWARNV
jgi:hypothetical protein